MRGIGERPPRGDEKQLRARQHHPLPCGIEDLDSSGGN